MTTIIESRREPALHPTIMIVTRLVSSGEVGEDEMDRLVEALDVLFAETAYENVMEAGLKQETLTLVRAACLRLAAVLENSGRSGEALSDWLSSASSDPVPEVKYALELPES